MIFAFITVLNHYIRFCVIILHEFCGCSSTFGGFGKLVSLKAPCFLLVLCVHHPTNSSNFAAIP